MKKIKKIIFDINKIRFLILLFINKKKNKYKEKNER